MNKTFSNGRKCSALMAASAGAAVCLTGGGYAAVVTGKVADLNSGRQTFGASSFQVLPAAVGGHARLQSSHSTTIFFYSRTFSGVSRAARVVTTASYIAALSASISIKNGLPHFSRAYASVPHSVTNKYFGVAYPVSKTEYVYGWLEVKSTNSSGTSISFDKWGYNNAPDTPIKTLADSLTTHTLSLSDGRVKLYWANTNEEGIARYEVQKEDASGTWSAVDGEIPGEGHYSAAAPKGSTCRLLVEMLDGATREIRF